MEAIKKITTIKNGSIALKELEALNNQEVEVIILPLTGGREENRPQSQKERLFQFKGAVESDFTDTSTNVDTLIYGK
ncbi:MAG: hypothetical protein AB1611_11360 [bacterium]